MAEALGMGRASRGRRENRAFRSEECKVSLRSPIVIDADPLIRRHDSPARLDCIARGRVRRARIVVTFYGGTAERTVQSDETDETGETAEPGLRWSDAL
jgi:hypothetical protein